MRKLLLFVLLVVFPGILYCYEVQTALEKKKFLLEEFTGIHCGYCPKGHKIANTLAEAQPSNGYIISVHAGHYATPGSDEPDFRTTEGTILNDQFGIDSYPCGTINRHSFSEDGSIIIDRGYWTKDVKAIHSEDAPVNLLIRSEYDGATRSLKIHVEGYYTAENQDADQELNIVWTQDNILGPQNGGNMGDEYVHQHALRGYITPVWGDTLTKPEKGNYFEKDYVYQLPDDVNKVIVKPEDIKVIAFVTNGKTDVLNVTGNKPLYNNYDKVLGATLSEPKMNIGARYGYHFFEVYVKNLSDKAITSAKFDITLNDKTQSVVCDYSIPSFGEKEIKIPFEQETIPNKTSYSIILNNINGQSISSNELTGEYSSPIVTTSTIYIDQQTDLYADDNHFYIKDVDGNIIKEFGPFSAGVVTEQKDTITLDMNKTYCMEVTDDWGDGILQPKGFVLLHSDTNSLIDQIYEINGFGCRTFFTTCLNPSSIKQNSTDNIYTYNSFNKTVRLTDQTKSARFIVCSSDGRCLIDSRGTEISLASLKNNIYIIKIIKEESSCIAKIALR